MHREVVDYALHPLDLLGHPLIHLLQQVRPVDRAAAIVLVSECLPCSGLKGSEDVALASSAIVYLLGGTLDGAVAIRHCSYYFSPLITPG